MKQLNENKATGIISGDSDLYFIDHKNHYIELKLLHGVQSKEQRVFQLLVESYGHYYWVVRSFDDFKKLIVNLLNGKF